MIRIVFTNGSVAEFDNIDKIYIEEKTHDENLVIVGELVPIGFGEPEGTYPTGCTHDDTD